MFTSATRTYPLAFIAAAVACTSAQAQLFRAYVSASGSDANPCTLQAPCRLLPAALNAVVDDGEIWMLDSANYNTASVDITKSVSILAVPGAVGSLVAVNDAPAVSIAVAGRKVALRNVVIGQLAGAPQNGTYGVKMTGASKLTIESSLLANLPYGGVQVIGTGTLKMINTTVRDSAAGTAVYLLNGATADISGSHMLQNFGGVRLLANSGTTTTANISDSYIGEAYYGAFSEAANGGTARILMTRSSITDSYFALYCTGGGNSTISFGSSLIANNEYPYWKDDSCTAIYTAGNNQINAYAHTYGALTPLTLR
jgi:hypothetical protein